MSVYVQGETLINIIDCGIPALPHCILPKIVKIILSDRSGLYSCSFSKYGKMVFLSSGPALRSKNVEFMILMPRMKDLYYDCSEMKAVYGYWQVNTDSFNID